MLKKFEPKFTITPAIVNSLVRIEAAKQSVDLLPLTPAVLENLRETARLTTVHYSTKIEGNVLTKKQVSDVMRDNVSFPGRERDEKEIKGCYVALDYMEQCVERRVDISEKVIKMLHALVISGGRVKVKPSSYRDGQNVIREGSTGAIVYMPPEAKDVPNLMSALVAWIKKSSNVPCPIVAGIAHYQFATIHPYYDGNGRTARLLATLILHLCGFDLKGIYSLDQYYSQDLSSYYEALSVGPSHNYYMGRQNADITKWVEYFCVGMAKSVENVQKVVVKLASTGVKDGSKILRKLDAKQKRILGLFRKFEIVTSGQIGDFLGFKLRTSRQLCKKWLNEGFIIIIDPSKKGRKYSLAPQYTSLLD